MYAKYIKRAIYFLLVLVAVAGAILGYFVGFEHAT